MNANMKVSEQCRIAASKGNQVEQIQRRASKLIPGLRDLTYEERLKECGLTTLDTRRLGGGSNISV